jgi:hypothetical protein
VEPATGNSRRGVLAASVITLTVLPILVLSNLTPPPASIGIAAAGDPAHVATVDGPESVAGATLGSASLLALDEVGRITDEVMSTAAVPRVLGSDIVEPVRIPDVAAAVDTTVPPSTAPRPRRTTTTVPRTTVPPTTAAPTTAAPTTAAPPATATPTVPPTTAAPTTTAPATQTIFGQPYLATWPSIDMWDRLAVCEAGSNWSINTGNGYYGGLQFSQSSWEWVGGSGSAAGASREEQIYRGNLLWEKQGWGAWPGCTRRYGWSKWQTSQ